jgi:rod shape determining protein RodA
MLIGYTIPFRLIQDTVWIQYTCMLVLLVAVLSMPHRMGAERWIVLGPLQFQPSEFAKATIIFLLAHYLASHKNDINQLRNLIAPCLLVLPPFALILKQPDLGTGLVFIAILVPMLFWAGLQPLHILLLASPGINVFLHLWFRTRGESAFWVWIAFLVIMAVVAVVRRKHWVENIVLLAMNAGVRFLESNAWGRLHDYQQKRITSFFYPDLDRLGQGYHVAQSKIAVGSGGLFGKGFMQGTQKELAFLPARHTDFIFSVLGEEFGLIGGLVVLTLFGVLLARGIAFARRSRHPFARYAAFGIVAYVGFQVMQNIGMTVGLFPVAGIPLPLVSYGGSSLAMTLFLLGILLNLGRSWREY